ncbi:unnamed protein product [Arctogadus glacialis]
MRHRIATWQNTFKKKDSPCRYANPRLCGQWPPKQSPEPSPPPSRILQSTVTSLQGTLRSRHDTVGSFLHGQRALLDPLPNGSHTLHNGKLGADPGDQFVRPG